MELHELDAAPQLCPHVPMHSHAPMQDAHTAFQAVVTASKTLQDAIARAAVDEVGFFNLYEDFGAGFPGALSKFYKYKFLGRCR